MVIVASEQYVIRSPFFLSPSSLFSSPSITPLSLVLFTLLSTLSLFSPSLFSYQQLTLALKSCCLCFALERQLFSFRFSFAVAELPSPTCFSLFTFCLFFLSLLQSNTFWLLYNCTVKVVVEVKTKSSKKLSSLSRSWPMNGRQCCHRNNTKFCRCFC